MCNFCEMEERTELSQRIMHSLKTTRSILCDRLSEYDREHGRTVGLHVSSTGSDYKVNERDCMMIAIRLVEGEIQEAYKTFGTIPYNPGDVIYA